MSNTSLNKTPIESRSEQVLIQDLAVNTVIGVYDWERTITQTLLISAVLKADFSLAAKSDRIQDALDYHQICTRITQVCQTTQANLLEHLIERLAHMILAEFEADSVLLTIKKPGAIAASDYVGVSAEYYKN